MFHKRKRLLFHSDRKVGTYVCERFGAPRSSGTRADAQPWGFRVEDHIHGCEHADRLFRRPLVEIRDEQ